MHTRCNRTERAHLFYQQSSMYCCFSTLVYVLLQCVRHERATGFISLLPFFTCLCASSVVEHAVVQHVVRSLAQTAVTAAVAFYAKLADRNCARAPCDKACTSHCGKHDKSKR